jgi:hypothetical protein
VRGTTRERARLAEIEATGAEPVLADPDRVATLIEALDHVTVVCILLSSATGPPEQLRALHGSRLEMLLTKLIDTTARGVVYEARGTVGDRVLAEGARQVQEFATRSHARAVLLDADQGQFEAWVASAMDAVERAAGARG